MTKLEIDQHRTRLFDVVAKLGEYRFNVVADVEAALVEVVYTLVDILEDLDEQR